MTAVRVVQITATCPQCGCPPRLRASEDLRDALRIADPEKVLITYRCHRKRPDDSTCNTVYEIKAKHFHQAAWPPDGSRDP